MIEEHANTHNNYTIKNKRKILTKSILKRTQTTQNQYKTTQIKQNKKNKQMRRQTLTKTIQNNTTNKINNY